MKDARLSSILCADNNIPLDKADTSVVVQQEEQQLEVNYGKEKYTYHGFHGYTVDVDIQIGVTVRARGRPFVSADGSIDSTGIMLWPASHLLCQYLVTCASVQQEERLKIPMAHLFKKPKTTMIELGCGCGISSIVAAITQCANYIVCTDVDSDALALCQKNLSSYFFKNREKNDQVHICVQRLPWGDVEAMDGVLSRLSSRKKEESNNYAPRKSLFDIAIGADIVYPSTSGPTLNLLLQSVNHMLDPITGVLLLSFISRDGFRSPLRLIQSCNENGFKIEVIDQSSFCCPLTTNLPPLMGAKLLCLRPCSKTEAIKNNEALGGEDCKIFPGIRKAYLHFLEDTYEEEWDAPPFTEGD
jgi:hypothetical protein